LKDSVVKGKPSLQILKGLGFLTNELGSPPENKEELYKYFTKGTR
jgi:hypothetical protein